MDLFDTLKNQAANRWSPAATGAAANNQSWRVSFADIPTGLAGLRALPEAALSEPWQAAALLIPALCLWPANQAAASEMLNWLKGPQPLSPREIQFINDRLRGKEYLPSSYFEGAAPENGYKPTKPYTVTINAARNSFDESGYAKLYLRSGGADSPRPVQLRQKASTGEWFLWEQMLLSDIRQPVAADPWA